MALPANRNNSSAIEYGYAQSEKMLSLCDPLKYLGISHFGYLKFFKDGTYLKVSNDAKWVENYLQKNLADKTGAFAESLKSVPLDTLESQLWPDSKGGDALASLYDADIWNGINLNKISEGSVEVFYFATNRENTEILNTYMNHNELLRRFILYFKDKAEDIIDTTDHRKLACQSRDTSFVEEVVEASKEADIDPIVQNFINSTEINRFYLNGKFSDVYMTPKENLCMHYLAKGKSLKEIGRLIDMSHRTVETHINNLKLKTGLTVTSNLVDVYLESDIKDVI